MRLLTQGERLPVPRNAKSCWLSPPRFKTAAAQRDLLPLLKPARPR